MQFVVALCLLCNYNLYGQFAKDTITNYDPDNPSHLIVAYEQAAQDLRVIRNKLSTGYNTAVIRKNHQDIQSKLDFYENIGEFNLKGASLNRMNDLISIFERQQNNLKGWQNSLITTTKELSDFRIDMFKHRDRLAIDQARLTALQKEYYDTRHAPLIHQIDSLNEIIEVKVQDILQLEYAVAADYSQLSFQIQTLKADVGVYWENMLHSEKISWSFLNKDQRKIFSGSLNQLVRTLWRITDFFKVNPDGVFYLILIFIGSMLALRRIREKDQHNPQETTHRSLYEQPVATSILLCGLAFSIVFPPTTSMMYDFVLLICYLPFLYILGKYLDNREFSPYIIFFIFLVVSKVQSIFAGSTGLFSIVMVASGVAFIYTILPQTLFRKFQIRWKWLRVFNWLLTALVIIGIIAILLQRVRLGGFLINAAGDSIALALILFYFAGWSDELISFLRKQPFFQKLSNNQARLDQFWHEWGNRIYLVLLVSFLLVLLKNFSLYTPVKDGVLDFFNSDRVLGDLVFTYGGIALFILVIYIATKLSATIKFLAEDQSYYKNRKETANLAVIMRFFLITVGFILALLVSGIPIDRITIIIGALSVGIGFGLQSIVNNLISGMILIFERPIQTGDLVELQQHTGFVKDIGIRSSVIRTYDGAEVIVPNGNLVSQEVINWTLSNRQRRVEMRVGVAYGSDVSEVTEVIMKVLREHPKVENYPAPAVLLDGFGENSIDFRCLIWTVDIDNWLTIKSQLSTSIYNALNESGITIPFPQRDLHVVSWNVQDSISELKGASQKGSESSEKQSDDDPQKPPA